MDKFWSFQPHLGTERGQSTVEYILVLAVVVSLSLLVFRSNQFRGFLGENGTLTDIVKRQLEYSFRHGRPGETRFQRPNYGSGSHDSYTGRFFIGKDPYPQ